MSSRIQSQEHFDFGGQISAAAGNTDPIFPDGKHHSLTAVISAAGTVNWQTTNTPWRDILAGVTPVWTTLPSGTLAASGQLDYDSGAKIFRVNWSGNTGTIDLTQTSSG